MRRAGDPGLERERCGWVHTVQVWRVDHRFVGRDGTLYKRKWKHRKSRWGYPPTPDGIVKVRDLVWEWTIHTSHKEDQYLPPVSVVAESFATVLLKHRATEPSDYRCRRDL